MNRVKPYPIESPAQWFLYAFENEAYRMLPGLLNKTYGIEIKRKLIRAEIGGKEINIFGMARKNGQDAIVAGEVKLRLEDRRKKRGKADVFPL